jgi:hypothetical protein
MLGSSWLTLLQLEGGRDVWNWAVPPEPGFKGSTHDRHAWNDGGVNWKILARLSRHVFQGSWVFFHQGASLPFLFLFLFLRPFLVLFGLMCDLLDTFLFGRRHRRYLPASTCHSVFWRMCITPQTPSNRLIRAQVIEARATSGGW